MFRSPLWKSAPQGDTTTPKSYDEGLASVLAIRTIILWACAAGLVWMCVASAAEGAETVLPPAITVQPGSSPAVASPVYVTRHPFYLVRPRFWHPQPVPRSSVFQGVEPYQWGNLGVPGKRSWAKQPGYYSTHTDWIFR
ncbi:hypothetical protein JCM19992_30320 [Thermostilla marina]